MRKYISVVVIFCMGLFGFFSVNKISNSVRDKDFLMYTIKEKEDDYLILPIEAIIENDTIIPGKNGKKVNYNNSYHNMKRFGAFNDNFLVYDKIYPSQRLKNNYDKYIISGNKNDREISLIFDANNRYLDNIINVLRLNKISANFLVDGLWGEDNVNNMSNISVNNYLINKGYDGYYSDLTILYTNSLINRFNSSFFCFLEEKNDDVIKLCKSRKMGTILSKKIDFRNYTDIDLENGKIVYLNIDKDNLRQLSLLIKYIKQKGYKIVTLVDLLKE